MTADASTGVVHERVSALVEAALLTASDEQASPSERGAMLVELATDLQLRPKTPDHLRAAVELYSHALALCSDDDAITVARIEARRATALQAMPDAGPETLENVRRTFEKILPVLARSGEPTEVAEAEMNLGLALHELAGAHRARMGDAIAAYQRALRTFEPSRFPVEFAILQNNLATAFLSLPNTDQRAHMREALAVQCFEQALETINLIDHPREYAMLQNNLGNALQQVGTSHALENRVRAIQAYNEALKVRTAATAPLEYANTIANKGHCLCNLPDDLNHPEHGSQANRKQARACFKEARAIFVAHGEMGKARLMAEALADFAAAAAPG
jgi:tetratricopeptide (TPR) repeat protein